jgi:hypothetical protein
VLKKVADLALEVTSILAVPLHHQAHQAHPAQDLAKPPVIGIVASHLAHGPVKVLSTHQSELVLPTVSPLSDPMTRAVVMVETLSFATAKFLLSKTTLLTVSLLQVLQDKVNFKPVALVTN